jgi:hypothetical protein
MSDRYVLVSVRNHPFSPWDEVGEEPKPRPRLYWSGRDWVENQSDAKCFASEEAADLEHCEPSRPFQYAPPHARKA